MLQDDGRTEFVKKNFFERFNPNEEYLGTNKPVNQSEPLVSVLVTTYQHEEFIEECLNGILKQKTDFPFEILIGEDESKDNTRIICKKYADKYPDKIRLFLRDRNTSQLYDEHGNLLSWFNAKWLGLSLRGKYIAICEGDDYWIHKNKLQKQIDFLQSNPDFSMCFHNAEVIYTYKSETHKFIDRKEGEYTGLQLYKKWLVPTASVVFSRKSLTRKNHFFNSNFFFDDLILFLTLAESGKIWYFDEVMSAYRRHEGGQVHKLFRELQNVKKMILHHKQILATFSQKYQTPGHKNISSLYFILFRKTCKEDFFEASVSLLKSFYYSPVKCILNLKNFLGTRLKLN